MLNTLFNRQIEVHMLKNGDEYYTLPKRDFDRFLDLADSSGFDVDYDNSEDSVIHVYESRVNEAASLTQFYSDSDKDVKEVAKEIDGIIDRAGFDINTKNELLTLITDLTDAYLVAMQNS